MLPAASIDDLTALVAERLDAGDRHAAVRALETSWPTLAAESGVQLRRLLAGFDPELWHEEPWIAAALGASHRSPGSRNGAAPLAYFDAAIAALDEREPDGVPTAEVRVHHAAALRATGRMAEADAELATARRIVAERARGDVGWRLRMTASIALQQAVVDVHVGRNADAAQNLDIAEGMSELHLNRAETVECLGLLALLAFSASRVEDASAFIDRARTAAEGTELLRSGFAAPALIAQLLIAIERYRLDEAGELAAEATAAAASSDWEAFCDVTVALLESLRGRALAGLDLLQRARTLYRPWSLPAVGEMLGQLLRAAIMIRIGQGDAAWALLAELPADEQHALCPDRFVAQLRLINGDLEGARAALDVCEALGDAHNPRTLSDVQLLSAAIEHERGNLPRSALGADRSLQTMARTGSRMPLLLIPPALLESVLRRAAQRAKDPAVQGIIADALARLEGLEAERPEQLTDRETAVLAQLRAGATVASAAAALFVSPNTVKTHLRSVYRKLGVNSRAEAVRKAETMGLYQTITPASPAAHAAGSSTEMI